MGPRNESGLEDLEINEVLCQRGEVEPVQPSNHHQMSPVYEAKPHTVAATMDLVYWPDILLSVLLLLLFWPHVQYCGTKNKYTNKHQNDLYRYVQKFNWNVSVNI